MGDTKERILTAALELFSGKGYEAVSVKDIADELGMTKGALYRHYRNKRDILDSILKRMEERDAEQAAGQGLPEGSLAEMGESYQSVSIEQIISFSKVMFRYWTLDRFASQFRKMLMLEQYRDPEMSRLFQQYLVSGPLGYLTDLFAALELRRPREAAVHLYAPMLLMYSVYDGSDAQERVLQEMDQILNDLKRHLENERKKGKNLRRDGIIIRTERETERHDVENLVREAFWNVYRPGCLEHYVLHRYRSDPAFVRELDLVMEKDGVLIGQNMFVRAVIRADDGREIPIMTMGPICITPELKRQGYGKLLLDDSLKRAAELGCGALCFEGNIGFYGKSGFRYASEFGIRYHGLPEDADASFFLCRELIPGYLDGVTGEYTPPEGYFVAEREPEDFERFDAQFPKKEKKKLPGQLV